jgi:hypothetical protein
MNYSMTNGEVSLMIDEVKQISGMELYLDNAEAEDTQYHLMFITFGKCVFWIEHSKVIAQKGDLLLIPGRTPYYAKSIPTVFHSQTRILFTGQTISEYVHRIRVKTAQYILGESELTVSEISECLGYSYASYFHRVCEPPPLTVG